EGITKDGHLIDKPQVIRIERAGWLFAQTVTRLRRQASVAASMSSALVWRMPSLRRELLSVGQTTEASRESADHLVRICHREAKRRDHPDDIAVGTRAA